MTALRCWMRADEQVVLDWQVIQHLARRSRQHLVTAIGLTQLREQRCGEGS